MELVYAHQVGFQQIIDEDYNLFITAAGYESRSVFLAEKLGKLACKKIVFGFDDRKNILFRSDNDQKFKDLGFDYYELPGNNSIEISKVLDSVCMTNGCKGIKILVDYSCMSKTWLSSIVHYFTLNELMIEDSEVYFSYTPSYFDQPKDVRRNQVNWELPKFFKSSDKPTAAIIGLGYEKFVGESLFLSLKNFTKYVFYSNPAFDNRFVEEVVRNNQQVLEKLDEGNVISYPIDNIKETDALLTSLCLELRLTHQVVLISIGPKPFALSCLLLAARYPDIQVWNITSSVSGNVYNREPKGEPIVCKTHFMSNDNFL